MNSICTRIYIRSAQAGCRTKRNRISIARFACKRQTSSPFCRHPLLLAFNKLVFHRQTFFHQQAGIPMRSLHTVRGIQLRVHIPFPKVLQTGFPKVILNANEPRRPCARHASLQNPHMILRDLSGCPSEDPTEEISEDPSERISGGCFLFLVHVLKRPIPPNKILAQIRLLGVVLRSLFRACFRNLLRLCTES